MKVSKSKEPTTGDRAGCPGTLFKLDRLLDLVTHTVKCSTYLCDEQLAPLPSKPEPIRHLMCQLLYQVSRRQFAPEGGRLAGP
jgi:hypothetical protein